MSPVEHSEVSDHGRHVALAFGALGIGYGDVGTSPLYAFRESFEHADLEVNQTNAYGVASVVFWALWIIISVKYLALVTAPTTPARGHPRPDGAADAPPRAADGHQTGDDTGQSCGSDRPGRVLESLERPLQA